MTTTSSDWISGMHAVSAVLRAERRDVYAVYAVDNTRLPPPLVHQVKSKHIPIKPLSVRECERRGIEYYQGIAVAASRYPYVGQDELLAQAPTFLLALDEIQDPHNCGALLRTAYCLGVEGVLVSRNRSVPITPAVVRSSAGASEFLQIAQISGLPHQLACLKKQGVWIVGADMAGTPVSECAFLTEPVVLVMGGEGEGLRQTTRKACDALVRIPMRKNAVIDSLNVSVSGAILMWEIAKRKVGAVPKTPRGVVTPLPL